MSLEIAKLERELDVKLPRPFVTALLSVAKTCSDWPKEYASTGDRLLLTDIDKLIELNKKFRKAPARYVKSPKSIAKKWPREYIVIARNESWYFFFDATETDPEIHTIHQKKVEAKDRWTPRHHRNFKELTKLIKRRYKSVRKSIQIRDQESRLRDRATRTNSKGIRNARKRSVDGRGEQVECPDLLEQGWLLARPALRLAASGDRYAAVWGGQGIVAPPSRGSWRHWLTVGCAHLPLNPRGLTGLISIYESDSDSKIKVVHDSRMRLPRQPNGEKMFGTRFKCLPSVGVVLSKGNSEIRRWLRGQGVWSGDTEGAHFDDQDPVDHYEAGFERHHPYFLNDCDAMLGGWGIVYPDSNWRNLMSKSLLVTTFRDSEPWLEVYDSGKAFSAYSHVS